MKLRKLFVSAAMSFVLMLVLFFGVQTNNAKAAAPTCEGTSKLCECYTVNSIGANSKYSETCASSEGSCDYACKKQGNGVVKYRFNEDPIYPRPLGASGVDLNYNSQSNKPTPGAQISDTKIPGNTTENSEVIKCGRPGQNMCTLCDLIKGMNDIIHYLRNIAIVVALLAMTIGGVLYVVSAGDKGLIDKGKSTMKNAAWGFVIIFAAFLIIDTTINYLGTKEGLGINVVSWGEFECSPNSNR